jgi:hypothetical protein
MRHVGGQRAYSQGYYWLRAFRFQAGGLLGVVTVQINMPRQEK